MSALEMYVVVAFLIGLGAYWCGVSDKEYRRGSFQRLQKENTTLKSQLDGVYHERNMLAMLAAKTMLDLGLQAGVGVDEAASPEWSHVLFIDVPNGQLSYHLAPHEVKQFRDQLPEYTQPWDGSSKDHHHRLIEAM